MKAKIYLFGSLLTAGLMVTSCAEDFLDQENTTSINAETFFDSDEAIDKAIYPLYNHVWQSFNDKAYYGMGDGRANNITAQYSDYIYPYTNFNETGISTGLPDAWGSLYSVVAQANNVINNIRDRSSSAVSEEAKTVGMAEARFMRGVAYWYIASLWGDAIIYTNTSAMVNNYVIPANPRIDVMEFAIRDLEYAAVNLPETSPETGRINKYTAYGMLSRVYLSMAGLTTDGQYDGTNAATDFNRGTRNTYYLDLARQAALKVVTESNFDLMEEYGDLFKIENNNCKEDMFQLQFITGTTDAIGWGCNQTISSYFGWTSMVADGTNWGGATYCSWDLFNEYETYDKRKHESVAWYGEYYPELNVRGGGYTYGVTEDAMSQGASIKKYVVGTNSDNGVSQKQSSGINTHMLRLAEVYLNLAEAILGNSESTRDETALYYFNEVRTRAGLEAKRSISYEDLRHERRMELAFEGQYWYDLVRRAYYQQQEVVNYINDQDRNANYYDAETHSYELDEDWVNPGPGVATATARNLRLPYPDADVNRNPYLQSDGNGNLQTVAYQFGEREVTVEDLFD